MPARVGIAEWDSTVWVCHIRFTGSPGKGRLEMMVYGFCVSWIKLPCVFVGRAL